jgi:hypothetical protein
MTSPGARERGLAEEPARPVRKRRDGNRPRWCSRSSARRSSSSAGMSGDSPDWEPSLRLRRGSKANSLPPHRGQKAAAYLLGPVRMSQEPDKLGFPGLGVADIQVISGLHLGLEELVHRDGAVHDVRLGQTGPVLETLEIVPSLPDQSHSDTVNDRRRTPVFHSFATRVSSHSARSSLPGRAVSHVPRPSRHIDSCSWS